ncbi:hypothetical protein [Gemmatimonas groenlandica]|uniref:DUF2330 domain-containing protein n=1 Tax=Gemmatimonas groenlandica TaxID=2732249 RepID=A0A6M4IGA8_9BACT|nr:hypothetical protein [Gemmatimonas groenlandica]QJR34134.1 hypothetical protein HKW67_00690 [Gemmatimonas groenlandica]
MMPPILRALSHRTTLWTSRRARAFVACSAVVAAALAAACSDRASSGEALPPAEFLFAAGDSTYWVRSGVDGMRVRSAPILLTEVDGRMFEIFLGDDGAEYPDASFASARLWSRELQHRDSTLLFGDSTVIHELAAWRRAHPRDAEIDPADEEMPDDPRTVVSDEIEIIDVHGPYITVEHLLNVDIDAGPPHRHEGRRMVVDVRSGATASLEVLVGADESRRVTAAAQASLAQLVDSIRTAGAAGDERASVATESLDGFRFDATSFGLTDIGRDPAVAFMVPGHGTDGEALALYLPPITVKAPVWWKSVRATLPEWAKDSVRVTWDRAKYEVAARPSADGDALALVLIGGAGGKAHEWPIATVAAPAYQLIPLDTPPIDSAARAALSRAFDISTSLDGLVQRASWPHRAITPLRATSFSRTR